MVRVLPKRNVTGFYTVSKKKTTTRSFLIKSSKKSPDFFLKLKRERKESIGGARYYSYPALPNPTQLIKREKKKKKKLIAKHKTLPTTHFSPKNQNALLIS